jgi:hypothetical protein
LFDKLNFLKIGADSAALSAEEERLMQLFQNRAGLKKAYADLQDEIHVLDDRLKQQEGATIRVQEQLDALGELLADPGAGFGALVFFQLRTLWKTCHQQLERFAAELARQQEAREAAKHQAACDVSRRERLNEADARLYAAAAEADARRARLTESQGAVLRLTAFWHYFTRRRLQRALEPLRAQVAAADAEVGTVHAERSTLEHESLPPFPGISLVARRNINLAIIAYAELLCEIVEGYGLAVRAKEAVARRVHDMSFGTRAECDGYMQRVQKAMAAVTSQNPLSAGVKGKLELLRANCQYRNDADTVPTADSLEGARDQNNKPAAYPWNVLAEDYWDLYTLLLR